MMFTGLGPKDTFTLPRNFAKGGEIATRRAKTGEPVFWPMPRPLADIFDNAPTHAAVTFCANSRGHPWTLNGFLSPRVCPLDADEPAGRLLRPEMNICAWEIGSPGGA
jgi:hypothetical protein